MAKLTKETKIKIEEYILNGINSDDTELKTKEEKLIYALNRFNNEFRHEINQYGKHKAFSNWLSGLSLDFDFYNYRILEIAKEWGQDISTESKQDKIISQWWDFLTNQFFKLVKKYKVEVI
jgi:hypothetical protein